MAPVFENMNITERLMALDMTLQRHNEGDWDKSFNPSAFGYSSFNDAGIEIETGEFLYAFTRMLKPQRVLETGTHWGIGASYIGMALKDNNGGNLDTVEFLPEIHAVARERIRTLGLAQHVFCHLGDVANFTPPTENDEPPYKLILLDTEPQTRFAELLKFYKYLQHGGFLFIHDLHQHMHQVENADHGFAWPYGPLPEGIKELVRTDKLRPFHIETPRGITGFYKVHPDDYKWDI